MLRSTNPTLRPEVFAKNRDAVGGGVMTLAGTVNKCLILTLMALFTAMFAWNSPTMAPGLMMVGFIGGIISFLVLLFKPTTSHITAPLYAIFEGLVLGALSMFFEKSYPGIVIQAVGLTFGTLLSMLVIYKTGIIKVTEKFRVGLFAAMGGIMIIYLIHMVMSLFGSGLPMMYESSPLGIAFSAFVVIIAALSLVLDFDNIEQGVKYGAPKFMEWYAAFGLLVTLIWLYMEILRLLAKLRRE